MDFLFPELYENDRWEELTASRAASWRLPVSVTFTSREGGRFSWHRTSMFALLLWFCAHTHTLWETLLFNSTVILTLTGSFSLTSCDRWVRSSGVTGLLILTWGSVQRDPAACWEEEEDSVIMVTSSFDCCFANLGQNIKKAAEHSKSETRRQDRKRETLRLQ